MISSREGAFIQNGNGRRVILKLNGMPYEKMELSPKVDIDLNESSLSFISSLSCKDDDSVILPDSMNSEGCSQMDASEFLKSGIVDSAQDLFNINFDKNSLSSETSDGLINTLTSIDGSSSLPDFSISDSTLNANIVQSSTCNFITSVSPAKNVEWPSSKSGILNTNKSGTTQLLILQKPTNLQTMLVGAKSAPAASSSNVAIVQTSTGVTAGTKYLTLPTLNTAGNIINAVNPSVSGKTNDVKILLSQVPTTTPTFITAKPIVSSGGNHSNSALQAPLKRAVTPSSSGQMVTKVIITSNASSNPSLASPVPVSATITNPSGQPQSILLTSPNKTFTLSRNNVFNLNNSHQVLKPILGTPAKQYVLSPVRPYQKTGYAPASYARSPRRIAPATNVTVSNMNLGTKLATMSCPTTLTVSNVNSGTKLTTFICPTTVTGASGTKISVSQSPTKVILKPVSQTLLKPLTSVSNVNSVSNTFTSVACSSVVTTVQPSPQSVSSGSTQSIQVPGSKFHYVRLVSAPATTTTTTTGRKETTILPVSSAPPLTTPVIAVTTASVSTAVSQVRPTVPIAPAKMVAPKPAPKFLIPAVSASQIRGTTSVSTTQLGQLPAGTFIPVGGSSSSYVMVPAQYVTQLQHASSSSGTGAPQMLNILPAPAPTPPTQSAFISLTSNPPNNFRPSSVSTSGPSAHHSPRRATPVETDNRQRKPCNCTKSQCLKLYCDCFANGEFCNNCNCNNCYNNLGHEEERQKAIKACLDRNPLAFHPKIAMNTRVRASTFKEPSRKSREGDTERRHTKGCNCKRSYCLKNYCECYEAKILCTSICKCIGCKNFEDSSERKTLMHLADAAEVRVQQQAAAKTNFSSDIFDFPTKPPVMSRTGERLPFAFVTDGVLEATCLCLLAHASDAEKSHTSDEDIERLVLEEFGRCLVRIIDCANKTKVSKMDVQ